MAVNAGVPTDDGQQIKISFSDIRSRQSLVKESQEQSTGQSAHGPLLHKARHAGTDRLVYFWRDAAACMAWQSSVVWALIEAVASENLLMPAWLMSHAPVSMECIPVCFIPCGRT